MPSLNNEVLALRKSGGFCCHKALALAEVSGQDSARFLQARLSNDVAALAPGQGQATCLLDGKGKIVVRGSLHCVEPERYWFLSDTAGCRTLLAELEKTHFREHVWFSTVDAVLTGLHGAKSELFLLNAGTKLAAGAHCVAAAKVTEIVPAIAPQCAAPALSAGSDGLIAGAANNAATDVHIMRFCATGEPGLILVHPPDATNAIEAHARALHMVPVCQAAFDLACLEAGDPGFALTGILMPETGLEQSAASYTKGCFPGQEVLARVRTYGATRRGLTGLQFIDDRLENAKWSDVQAGAEIKLDGEPVGTMHKLACSPTLGKTIALAFIDRALAVPGKQLQLAVADCPARSAIVNELPFYSSASKKQQASKLYQQSLQEFAAGSELKAIEMLREAIELDPLHADSYESLGVILSRNEQLDEAIAFMKQLSFLDPESIMAHANLSVFYMQQGDKEAAEEEKAIAMSIRMSQLAREAANQQQQEDERRQMKENAQQRMEMFRQVLAIDPDDFLANAGIGSVYVDLEQYEQAIPHLLKALQTKPSHAVAYLSLGEAYEMLGKADDAIATYNKGISMAAQKGTGEPMKKMQLRLQALQQGQPVKS